MLYAQAALNISRDNLEGYQKTVDLMKVRLDAGDIDRTDFDRVDLQLAGFESDPANAELTLRQGSISLQTLLGLATPSDSFAITGSLAPPNMRREENPRFRGAFSHSGKCIGRLKSADAPVTTFP